MHYCNETNSTWRGLVSPTPIFQDTLTAAKIFNGQRPASFKFEIEEICQSVCNKSSYREIPAGGTLSITIDTIACDGTDKEINKLEHVTLTVSFQHRRRGDVSIDLFSPSGTRNEMLSTRRYDDSKNGLHDWTFMTVHNWGENPKGVWVMNVTDNIATLNKGVDVNGYLQHDTSKQEADVEDLEEEVGQRSFCKFA